MVPQGFTDRMMRLLGEEYTAFAAAYDLPRSVGLRLNPLKADVFPDLRRFSLAPIPWAEHGFFYDGTTRPGLHPWHDAGLYYMQEPSAMAPAELLDVRPSMRVLDLCAAPGGKSTQIAAKLRGEGLLVSNEIHPQRAKILSRNLERCAVKNALVLNEHPARLAERFPAFFHRVMVDAPCSGEGMFRKEEAAGEDWSEEIVRMCADRQHEILCSAAGMLAAGGRLVYSTCTFSPEENEGVIERFLSTHPEFDLVAADKGHFAPGRPAWVGGREHLTKTCRLWPHKLRGEGHFAAVLEKTAGAPLAGTDAAGTLAVPGELTAFAARAGIEIPQGRLLSFGQSLFLAPEEMPGLAGIKVLRPGLELGQVLKNRFEPAHAWALYLKTAAEVFDLDPDGEDALRYLKGETLAASNSGWTLVTAGGLSLGWGKGSGGILKNHVPKGLRRL